MSGGGATLKGAVASAEAVKAQVGGKLIVECLQGVNTYTLTQKSAGFSANSHWTAERIKVEIDGAWQVRVPSATDPNMWQGRTPSGVLIEGYSRPGARVTAYPVYGR